MKPSRRAVIAGMAVGAARLAVAGPSGGSGTAAPALKAGAAAVDITPAPGLGIDGVLMRSGPAKGAHDRLNARSLALSDGTTTLVLTICDVRMIARRLCDEAKRRVSQQTGIPEAHLLVAATHSHAAPTPIDLFDEEPYKQWEQAVIDGIAQSMTRAVKNLTAAKIGRASTRKPEYAFCRRWLLKPGAEMPANPWGGRNDKVLTNPGGKNRVKVLEPAGPVDDELTVLSVRRASDDAPLALLANYSTHYVGGYAGQLISSDYYGAFSERVKQLVAPAGADPGFVAMMFNGTSGNTNTVNFRLPPDASPPWERIARVGDDMANTALTLIRSIEHRADVRLTTAVREIEVGVRKPDAKRLAWAEAVRKDESKNRGWTGMYARETDAMTKYPDSFKLLIQAMRVGDFAISAAPCEVFAETGLEIKRRSPIKPTFNIGLANGYHGYLPTPEQHALGGYETWLARTSYLEVDASTKIRDAALALLAQLA
jgi:hypothetical protein